MFYGIDLHSDSFKAAVLDEKTDAVKIIQVSLRKEFLAKFLEKLTKEDYVAVEASTNTFWFVDQLVGKVAEYFVVDPMKFSIIGKSNKKTDKVDAIKLAKKLKYYVMFDRSKDEFPTVTIPPKAVRELRSLFTSYQMLKKERNMTKNCIHALFKQNGLIEFRKLDLTKLHVREKIRAFKTDPVLEFQLKQMLDKLDELDKVQDAYKTMIIQIAHAEFDNQIRLLTSIKGISPFLASAIMADIMDVNRFANAKHMCSYLRAAPKIKASGDSTQVGKLNKQSRGLTMSLMAESVTHFVNSSKKMTEFYASKIKGKSAGKVRVAVIRKILATVYYMLTREVLYYYVDSKNYDNKLKQYQRVLKSKGKV